MYKENIGEEDLRPYWLGSARISGPEDLWGGIGGRRSIKIEGNTLTIHFPWLRRFTTGRSIPTPVGKQDRLVRSFEVYDVYPVGERNLRIHCGDAIITLRPRYR